MRYMLATDSIHTLVNECSPRLFEKLALSSPDTLCVSAITAAEIELAVRQLQTHDPVRRLVRQLSKQIQTLPWDAEASRWYAELFSQQTALPSTMGNMDLMVAAHALATGSVLVTASLAQELRAFNAPMRIECWS